MKTAVLICPGRGTYNRAELGTLARTFPDPALMARFDAARRETGRETLTELDGAARFSQAKHGRGDAAAGLIYAATYGDMLNLSEEIEVVAVTGNSMGWYTTLAAAGAVTPEVGFDITTTMGAMMQDNGQGGQTLYPHMGEVWLPDPTAKQRLMDLVAEVSNRPNHVLALSIDLGGTLVLAGNEAGLAAFEAEVAPHDRFPMRLPAHAGFHSPLVQTVSDAALAHFSPDLFGQPNLPMIDGRGQTWWPGATDTKALWDYTFDHQVTRPYDFTRAIAVAAREFAPDLFIVTGPGTTLGGAVAQSLILTNWSGLTSKAAFQSRQAANPILISMGREEQRGLVTKGP
ncbi:MAG: ACP S-malonyltransferase [Pseudomonadota bacterium]